MIQNLTPFLLHWAVITFALWLASHVFSGIKFAGVGSLLASALLLGIANTIIRPILIVLTLPLTVLTLGLFLLVINALMMKLVAWLVHGFKLSGFWTAFFASIFVSILSFLIELFVAGDITTFSFPANGTMV
jgi:putative membrane protein